MSTTSMQGAQVRRSSRGTLWVITPLVLLLLAQYGACNREIAAGQADGAKIFEQACSQCHGATGKPSAQMMQQLGVRDLTSPAFKNRVTEDLVRFQVKKGSDNKRMPAFEFVLTPAQIDAVAKYVVSMPERADAPK